MESPFTAWLTKLWKMWEIRTLVIISLSIQIFLILFGSRRKRTYSKWMIIPIWLGYLLADSAATLALGVLSNMQGNSNCDSSSEDVNPHKELLGFWSPFLLLHLGGPDTITAFSLEDNELWLRHLLGLIFQVIVAFYIFRRSLPEPTIWVATVLIFIAGIIKYSERTLALMIASRDNFRNSMITDPDPGPNYAKFMEEYSSKRNAGFNARILWEREPESQLPSSLAMSSEEVIEDMKLISEAHHFFQIFKRLMVDLVLTFHDRNESQTFFLKRNWEQAFKVIEIELGFVYDVLYTKSAIIYTVGGIIFRVFSVLSICTAFVIFFFEKKLRYRKLDTVISYVLLGGAIALEIWSLTRLLFSDSTFIWMKQHNCKWLSTFFFKVISYFRPIGKSRWSNYMAQYNLIDFCIKDQPSVVKRIMKLIHLKDIFDKFWYRTHTKVTNEYKELIFEDLKCTLKNALTSTSYKHFSTSRGELALQSALVMTNYDKELQRSIKVEFDESILLWHIATDICYYLDEVEKQQKQDTEVNQQNQDREVKQQYATTEENQQHPDTVCLYKDMSRAISNYMLYLLVSRPFMLTAGIGQIRFGDTCAEAKKFLFQGKKVSSAGKFGGTCVEAKNFIYLVKKESSAEQACKRKEFSAEQACKRLCEVDTEVAPIDVKGDRSKSVLFDASRLAKSLLKLDKKNRWKIMSDVWVEMMCYAANKCGGYYHAQRLSVGGELLTFIGYLMAHLGIGDQYRVEAGHARAKLITEM